MGVAGLWKELHSAASKETFDKLALDVFVDALDDVQAGKSLPRNKLLGLRVGVDASAWFHHSEKTESGANPHLRTLFFRVARLARCGSLPLFVFDGPHRPKYKRGKYIQGSEHGFQRDFTKIVEAFGFEWRVAPGEAEAELAMLNARGTLDLVITDDVDCLLFGATKVMKHAILAKNSWTPTVFPCVYDKDMMAIEMEGITADGLILVALMSGGDYDQTGLEGVGPVISMALAKGGYGDELARAIRTLSRKDLTLWLQSYRGRIQHELRHNPNKLLKSKAGAKADKIGPSWPKVETAMRYYNPVISSHKDYRNFDKVHTWDGRIDIGKIVQIMDEYFEFLHKEILQTLRSTIWDVIIIQHLIRSLYNGAPKTEGGEKLTPTKKLAAALDAFDLASPSSSTSSSLNKLKTALPAHIRPIFRQVTKARGPCQTSHTDEVQLIIDPTSFADEARQYLRYPEPNAGKLEARKEQEWRQKLASGQDVGDGPVANRQLKCDDPDSEEKYWIPESLLRLAYPEIIQKWEDAVAAKEEAKANKGKKKTKKDGASSSSPAKSPPKVKSTKSTSASPTKAAAAKKNTKAKAFTKASSYSSSSDSEPPKKRMPPKSVPAPYSDSDSEEEDVFSPKRLPPSTSQVKAPAMAKSVSAASTSTSTSSSSTLGGRPTVKGKANARGASAISDSNSSDSDIEIISRKSPKKSPRKSDTQQTARPPILPVKSFNATAATAKAASGMQGSSKEKDKMKKFQYQDLSDPDDSDDERLPDLPTSRKEPNSQPIRPSASSASASSYYSSGTRSYSSASSSSTSSLLSRESNKAASAPKASTTVPKRSGSATTKPSAIIIIDSD